MVIIRMLGGWWVSIVVKIGKFFLCIVEGKEILFIFIYKILRIKYLDSILNMEEILEEIKKKLIVDGS